MTKRLAKTQQNPNRAKFTINPNVPIFPRINDHSADEAEKLKIYIYIKFITGNFEFNHKEVQKTLKMDVMVDVNS